MGRFVYKPHPDKDEYILWSTVVENAVSPVLSRAEMTEFMLQDAIAEAERRIEINLDQARMPDDDDDDDLILVTNVQHDDFEAFYDLDPANLVEFVNAQEAGDTETLSRILTEMEDD